MNELCTYPVGTPDGIHLCGYEEDDLVHICCAVFDDHEPHELCHPFQGSPTSDAQENGNG